MIAYVLGVIIVFVYIILKYIVRFLNLHNKVIELENLKKIGWHYNFIKDEYYFIPSEKNWHDKGQNFLEKSNWRYLSISDARNKRIRSNIFEIILQFIVLPLLSRVSILLIVYVFINERLINKKTPKEIKEKIKEYEFELEKKKLSKRQVRILWIKLSKLLGIEIENVFHGDDESFTLKYINNTISIDYREEEYKIKGTDIQKRVINYRGCRNDDIVYYIKDGVVTDENPKDFYWPKEERKEAIKRKPLLGDLRQIAYILYHDENLSDSDLKDYLRQNIDNIDSCWKEMREFFSKHNIDFSKREYKEKYYIYSSYEWSNYDLSKEEREKNEENFYKEMEKIAEKYGCTKYQLLEFNKIGKVEGTYKYKVGNGDWIEKNLDESGTIPCNKSTRDAFEPEILPFYKGLIQDI